MKVYDTLAKYGMLTGAERVLCALSGGTDSAVLTHFLASNAKKLGITVAAAHFSHGIRKDAAQAERKLCEDLCRELGVELFCGEGDSVDYAGKNKMGIEQAARELRYAFLKKTADEWRADKIATAHHANDNAETVIMNACRGASLTGLSGIPVVRDRYIRPLIQTYRCEIEEYACSHNIAYATDATNFEPCCRRNEIRLLLLPQMRQAYAGTDVLLNRFSELARLYNERINCKAKELVSCCETKENRVSIPVGSVLETEKAVAARVFELMFKKAGGKSMLSSRHIEAIYKICRESDPSAQVSLPGIRAGRSYEQLVFAKPECNEPLPDTIIRMGETAVFGQWQIEVKEGRENNAAWFDKSRLEFPLILRSRRQGDRIFINGCTKSVKKLMIERKIPKEMRDNLPVLLDNNRVLAVAGIGYDNRSVPDTDKNIISIILRRVKT